MKWSYWLIALAIVPPCLSCSAQNEEKSKELRKIASSDPAPETVRSNRPMANQTDDIRWLTENSPFIFVGRLVSAKSEKDARGLIITKNRFDVERVVAGDAKTKSVTLTTLGGTLGKETMKVSNMPEFEKNRTYVVFTDLKRTVYNPVTANRQGVFRVVENAVYTDDGRALIGIEGERIQTGNDGLEPPAEKNQGKVAPVSANPETSGSVVSLERAVEKAEKPMTLDAFLNAVLAARQQ